MGYLAPNGVTYGEAISPTEIAQARTFLEAHYVSDTPARLGCMEGFATQTLLPLENPRADIRWLVGKDSNGIESVCAIWISPPWQGFRAWLIAGAFLSEDQESPKQQFRAMARELPWMSGDNKLLIIYPDQEGQIIVDLAEQAIGVENVSVEFASSPQMPEGIDPLPDLLRLTLVFTDELIQECRRAD